MTWRQLDRELRHRDKLHEQVEIAMNRAIELKDAKIRLWVSIIAVLVLISGLFIRHG